MDRHSVETQEGNLAPDLRALVPELEINAQGATQAALERRRHARIQSACLSVLATGAVLTLMYVAKPVLVVTLTSVLIAFVLAPIVDVMERMRIRKPVGSLIAVLLMCGALYGLFYVTYNQADDFITQVPKYSGKIRTILTHVRQRAERFRQTTQNVLPEDAADKKTVTVKQATSWADSITSGAASATELVVMASFVPFLVFFMLSWQEHVRTSTVMLFSMENRNTAYVTLGLISAMIRSFIAGNLLIGLVIGAISTVVFWALGVPYFYIVGIVSGFVSLVPYLGVVLAAVPPIIVSLGTLNVKLLAGVLFTVLGSHLFALNVLYPKIIGKRLQLNPLAVTLALLFWGWLWGAMGLILAVPITAALKIILDHVERLRPYGAWLGE